MVFNEKRKENQISARDWFFKNIVTLILCLAALFIGWGEIKGHAKDVNVHISKKERQEIARKEGRDEARHINVMDKFKEIAKMIKGLRP